jgi:hypothetical protein
MDTEHQPSLAIYLRTSKKSPTNEAEQILKLQSAVNYFINSENYWLNSSWWFMDEITIESDSGKAGDCINDGLYKFLDKLSAHDVVLVQNIKRFTRMNSRDDELKYLVTKLFDNDREVWHLSENTNEYIDLPIPVTKEQFIEYAELSEVEYNHLRELSKYGNEIKTNAKLVLKNWCLKLFQAGFSNRVIAMEIDKHKDTVKRYKRELKREGLLT